MVLYGDTIPESAVNQTICDIINSKERVDLVLVMGTSLQVAPFCAIPNLVSKTCTRALIDIRPHNAFTNNWSDSDIMTTFGRTEVPLQPYWDNTSKWADQHIITQDTDSWSTNLMAIL